MSFKIKGGRLTLSSKVPAMPKAKLESLKVPTLKKKSK